MNMKRFSRSMRTGLMIVTLGLSLTAVPAQAQHHSRHGGHHGYHGYSHLFGYGGHYRYRGYSSRYYRYRPYSYYGSNDYGDYSRSSSAIKRRSLEDDKGWSLLAQGKARRAKAFSLIRPAVTRKPVTPKSVTRYRPLCWEIWTGVCGQCDERCAPTRSHCTT